MLTSYTVIRFYLTTYVTSA